MLKKSRTNKYLGGVCGGLEASTGVSAIIYRLAALFVPGGWLIYLAMYLFLPTESEN